MSPQEFLLRVFCLIDDPMRALGLGRLRQRGFAPKLGDSEVITIEIVGEFWGLDADRELFRHFRQYHTAEFPALAQLSRTTFARQAVNVWRVQERIRRRLVAWLSGDDPRWPVDSLPIEACQFARATFRRRFPGEADSGYDHPRKRTDYGFRLHLRTSGAGVIEAYELTSARVADATVTPALAPPPGRVGIGDRGDYNRRRGGCWRRGGVTLHAPYHQKGRDPDPRLSLEVRIRGRTLERGGTRPRPLRHQGQQGQGGRPLDLQVPPLLERLAQNAHNSDLVHRGQRHQDLDDPQPEVRVPAA
jgi:hypothetical protein